MNALVSGMAVPLFTAWVPMNRGTQKALTAVQMVSRDTAFAQRSRKSGISLYNRCNSE